MNLFTNYMHADSLELVLHCCNISQCIYFHCLTSWYNLHNPNSGGVNTDPLLRFQHDVGTKVLCLNVGTPIVKNHISRKIIHYLLVWGFGWGGGVGRERERKS